MTRNELLTFRILRILRHKQVQCLSERQIMTAIRRETDGEFDEAIIRDHLRHMQQHGLLKPIDLYRQGNAYALDWAGYDYLDAS